MDALMFRRGAVVFSANSKRSAYRRWLGLSYDGNSWTRRGGSRVWLIRTGWPSPQSRSSAGPEVTQQGTEMSEMRDGCSHEVLNEIWRDCSIFKRVGAVTRFHLEPCSSLTSLWLLGGIFFPPKWYLKVSGNSVVKTLIYYPDMFVCVFVIGYNKLRSFWDVPVWNLPQLTTKIRFQHNHTCPQTNISYLVPHWSFQSSNTASGSLVSRQVSRHFEHEHNNV